MKRGSLFTSINHIAATKPVVSLVTVMTAS
ncbi:MAG: hypothetical protein ACI97K_003432 [Glaciecola sp.]